MAHGSPCCSEKKTVGKAVSFWRHPSPLSGNMQNQVVYVNYM